jgi:hypothetical protein
MADAPKSSLPLMSLAEGYVKSLNSKGAHLKGRPYIIMFAVLVVLFLIIEPAQTLLNFSFLGFFAPLWAPLILYEFAFKQFVESRKAEFIAGQKTLLLELMLPRDTMKTPLAMEIILANMHQAPGEGNWYRRLWKGGVRPWWSLEIVSLGGRVHFYIWTRAGFRRAIESYFYAQFPDMQIIEAEDYSVLFDPSAPDNDMFGDEFAHTKEDPYPIKTYVEFGLDKPGSKPEEQIDPLSQVIELFSSLGPKEQLWLQMIIRTTGKEKYPHENKVKAYTWKDEGIKVRDKLRDETAKEGTYLDPITGRLQKTPGFPNPTKGQGDVINALERNIGKQGFDVGIRFIYSAPKDSYQGTMIGPSLTMFKPFSSETLNGFKPAGSFSATFEDYPWEDRSGELKRKSNRKIVEMYRRRAYYHAPYEGNWMIMSTEELATLFHVPSATIASPGLPRIQSTTGGAPANLPM